jgi:hypothetical protein
LFYKNITSLEELENIAPAEKQQVKKKAVELIDKELHGEA